MKKIYKCPKLSMVKFESEGIMLISGRDDGYGALNNAALKNGKAYKLKS